MRSGKFFAERCNVIAMSGCCHDMLSVCRRRLWRECSVLWQLAWS